MTDRDKRIDEAINGDYTPGPWTRSQNVSNRIDGPPDGYVGPNTIAVVSNPVNHDEDANVNLIAAAPDLAEAYREKCAEVGRLREALDVALFCDLDPEDRAVIKQILEDENNEH